MTSFIIAPYPPIDDPSKWDELSSLNDLKIDPNKYREEMKNTWPMVEFFSTSNKIPLQWMINIPNADTAGIEGTIGMLHSDLQVVSFDTPYEPFFLWHRQFIDIKHKLYLFNTSSWKYLELKVNTSLEDISGFVGRVGE
jgi:hypothetical protein